MKTRKFLALLGTVGILFASCSDDDDGDNPDPVSQEELITTMTVTLAGGGDPVVLNLFDEDGPDGPGAPVVEVDGNLKASTSYVGTISLLNESEEEPEFVNEEIEEEADEHQFFYLTEDLGIVTTYTDMESNYVDSENNRFESTNPVGIDFTLMTSEATGTGKLRVVLIHEPNKGAAGVASGDITNAAGTPDIDWTFDITVE